MSTKAAPKKTPSKKTATTAAKPDAKPAKATSSKAEAAPIPRGTTPFNLRRILVPTDFSELSKKALAYAIPFAAQFGATIHLAHVVQFAYLGTEAGIVEFPVPEKEMRAASVKRLETWSKTLVPANIPVERHVLVGQPVWEIVDLIKRANIDLAIISTHGYTGLKHVLLGSVAENIVRHADCPVLTVHLEEHDFVKVKL